MDHTMTETDTTAVRPTTLDSATLSRMIPARDPSSRKGQNGKVLVVGGSYLYHGAPILASLAALRFGVDLVYTAVPPGNVVATRSASPDLIVIPMADAKLTRGSATKLLGIAPTNLDSAVIGMGLAIQERGALLRLVRSLLNMGVRLVLDASALVSEVLPLLSNTASVVTPHAEEFRHLFGETPPPQSDMNSRMRVVAGQASRHGITILLKGRVDIISDGRITYLCDMGSPGMTVGGTGDVLAGLVAGALASSQNPLNSAALAAYANCKAGMDTTARLGYHMTASDLIGAIPGVLREFDEIPDKIATR